MSGLTLLLFVVVSWIFVYLQVQGIWFRHWIGSGISFLPAFIVYTAWAQPVWVATCITILSSLWLDALSNQPLGLSLIPFVVVAVVVQDRRQMLVTHEFRMQFWLGAAASLAVNIMTYTLLRLISVDFIASWGTWWILLVSAVLNGIACVVLFPVFNRLRYALEYQPILAPTYRYDREIKRGRN